MRGAGAWGRFAVAGFGLAAALCAGVAAGHATPATGAVPVEARTLRVVADEWCPYTCAADAPQSGYLVDLVRAMFEPLGYRIDYRVMP